MSSWMRYLCVLLVNTCVGVGAITCYTCRDECVDRTTTECSLFNSTHCYYLFNRLKNVERFCGEVEYERRNLPLGCSTELGSTICKCNTDRCNFNFNLADSPATSSTPITAAPWYCYVCQNCGFTRGRSTDCSLISPHKFCTTVTSPAGSVSRSCGGERYNFFENGCVTREEGRICKCSTQACNGEVTVPPPPAPTLEYHDLELWRRLPMTSSANNELHSTFLVLTTVSVYILLP